jgi:UDP-glucose/iron transport system permease protein
MIGAVHLSLGQVAATLALVAVALVVSAWQRAELERDIEVAAIRSFVQLTAIGYVIKGILASDNLAFVAALLAVMVSFGALTARGRAKRVPGAFWPLLIGLRSRAPPLWASCSRSACSSHRYLVPVGGMVIGNAMTAAAVALNRLGDDVADSADKIEATLALGATATQAMRPVIPRSLRSGMIPLIDSTKTTGLIFFPGTMVGMLLAGAAPIDAVRLQLILYTSCSAASRWTR